MLGNTKLGVVVGGSYFGLGTSSSGSGSGSGSGKTRLGTLASWVGVVAALGVVCSSDSS